MKSIAKLSLIKHIVSNYTSGLNSNLGQNYLVNEKTLSKILKIIQPKKTDTFLEIGAGIGVFSFNLLFLSKFGYLIEIDEDKLMGLSKVLENYTNYTIINDDAVKINYSEITNDPIQYIFGALPYNVSKKIIFNILTNKQFNWDTAFFILQKEVAIKFAGIDTKNNFLNRYTQLYADIEYCFDIPSSSFYPIPRVDSGLIKLVRKVYKLPHGVNPEKVHTIVKIGYSQPRKKIKNNLKSLINTKDIDPRYLSILHKRPDDLSLEDWSKITFLLSSKENSKT